MHLRHCQCCIDYWHSDTFTIFLENLTFEAPPEKVMVFKKKYSFLRKLWNLYKCLWQKQRIQICSPCILLKYRRRLPFPDSGSRGHWIFLVLFHASFLHVTKNFKSISHRFYDIVWWPATKMYPINWANFFNDFRFLFQSKIICVGWDTQTWTYLIRGLTS